MTSQHPLRGVVGFVIPGVIALAAGVCGGETGPRRHAISGTVTFKGQPVPAGQIAFELDASRGNRGPAGYAEITDGWYSTHMGAVAGPHIVRINGQTGPVIEETVDVTLFVVHGLRHEHRDRSRATDHRFRGSGRSRAAQTAAVTRVRRTVMVRSRRTGRDQEPGAKPAVHSR